MMKVFLYVAMVHNRIAYYCIKYNLNFKNFSEDNRKTDFNKIDRFITLIRYDIQLRFSVIQNETMNITIKEKFEEKT